MIVLLIGLSPRNREAVTLAIHLRWQAADFLVTSEAQEGLELTQRETPDLVFVDPTFKDRSLSETIRDLRQVSDAALVVLGKAEDEIGAAVALELGADEYLKAVPAGLELVARVTALLRRTRGAGSVLRSEGAAANSGLVLDGDTYEAYVDGKTVRLTPTEFRLLDILMKSGSHVVAHRSLERLLWEDHFDSGALLKKYIQRVRRKLGDDPKSPRWIVSVHGIGYRFISRSTREKAEVRA